MTEVRPIDLRLLTRKHLQLQERFTAEWPQAGNGSAQLPNTAPIAAIPNHLVDAGGAQARVLIEGQADELAVRIDQGCSQRLRTLKALRFDGVPYGIGMDAQFAGNGADLPMFGVKVAANPGAGFRTDHQKNSPSFWNAWKRIDEASQATADPATEPTNGCASGRGCGDGGFSTPSVGPHWDDAGEVIEKEA